MATRSTKDGPGERSRAAAGPSGMPSGQEVAKRFALLLERFTRGDGEAWRAVEIEAATGGEVTSSYVSALRKGKFKRPGIRQLEMISEVMGFPFELWRVEPELWDEELKKHKTRGSFRGPTPDASGLADAGVREPPHGAELGALLDTLFEGKTNPATGEPYTEAEVATRSRGRLTEEEVRAMRRGEQAEPPPEIKLLAFSEVFDVPAQYWYSAGGQLPEFDLEGLRQMYEGGYLIRHRQQDLSPAQRNMLELFFAALESGGGTGTPGRAPDG